MKSSVPDNIKKALVDAQNPKSKNEAQKRKTKPDGNNLKHLEMSTGHLSSASDLTGLIPAKPEEVSDRESYKEIYDYEASPKDVN